LQMDLFDAPLAEVIDNGQRYILRRNPERAKELAASREAKYATLTAAVTATNTYLAAHPLAKPDTHLTKLKNRAVTLRISSWATFDLEQSSEVG
jgi:hypothetical protein